MKTFAFLVAMLAALSLQARTATDFFIEAPDTVVPLLSRNARLDMVDYFNFGSPRMTANAAGGEGRLVSASERVVELTPDIDVNIQIAVVPADGDSLIAVVTTLRSPWADSMVDFYHTDWSAAKSPFSFGYADWLSEEGRPHEEEIRLQMPFMPVSAAINPDATVITFTNEAPYYLSDDDYRRLRPWLVGSVSRELGK